MHDIKITGGTIVDGTGSDRFTGDVAIADGKIVEIASKISGAADRTIDAEGRLVTPGFVDIHTHYDGQVTWDDLLEPSSVHGVTSMVMGNCGVGFAPVAPGKEDWLIQLMELSEIMLASSGRNWSLEMYNPYPQVMEAAPASNDYQPGFMVDLMVKDLGLAMEIAEHCDVDNTMGQLARELYTQHQQAGNGQRDFSSILQRLQK